MAATVCKLMGVIFIIVAIWGFITGHEVLIFHVNAAHNVVHLLSGLLALACGFAGERPARLFSAIFGAVYGLVALLGFLGVQPVIDLLHLNMADNWLHAGIAVLFIITAIASASARRAQAIPPPGIPPHQPAPQ
jgi:hypothetical protein